MKPVPEFSECFYCGRDQTDCLPMKGYFTQKNNPTCSRCYNLRRGRKKRRPMPTGLLRLYDTELEQLKKDEKWYAVALSGSKMRIEAEGSRRGLFDLRSPIENRDEVAILLEYVRRKIKFLEEDLSQYEPQKRP